MLLLDYRVMYLYQNAISMVRIRSQSVGKYKKERVKTKSMEYDSKRYMIYVYFDHPVIAYHTM